MDFVNFGSDPIPPLGIFHIFVTFFDGSLYAEPAHNCGGIFFAQGGQ